MTNDHYFKFKKNGKLGKPDPSTDPADMSDAGMITSLALEKEKAELAHHCKELKLEKCTAKGNKLLGADETPLCDGT